MTPAEEELARLRLLAYSREGTDDDRRRLHELEHASRDDVQPADALPPGPHDSQTDEADIPVTRPPAARRRRIPVVAAAAAGAGALLGAAVTVAVLGVATSWGSHGVPTALGGDPLESSLTVFDRDTAPNDVLPAEFAQTATALLAGPGVSVQQTRWLGSPGDAVVYAIRGTVDGSSVICLMIRDDGIGKGSCTSEANFAINGLELAGGSTVDVRWGPLGTELWVRLS